MSVNYPKYEQYKETGIEWLPQVPAGWNTRAIKRIVAIPVTDGPHETPEMLDEGVPFISAEAIKNDRVDFSKKRGFISAQEHKRFSKKYCPKKGDIYMIKSGATTGNIAQVTTDDEFNIWSPLAVIRTDSELAYNRFVFYCMKSHNFRCSVELGWSFGTQQNIGMGVIQNLFVTLPPRPEQKAIAAFLDEKTGKIDALLEKLKRQKELLTEKRTALITRAVTRGLNPNAPLKATGIEWLPQVPEHWEVKRLKLLLKALSGAIRTGPFGSQLKSSDIQNKGYKVYTQRNVIQRNLLSGDDYISDAKFNELKAFEIFKDDILLTTRGTIGKCLHVDYDLERGVLHPCLMRIQLNKKSCHYPFIIHLFENTAITLEQLRVKSNSTIIDVIYQDSLKEIFIPIPPLSEQKEIAEYLDTQTAKIDLLQSKTDKQIELLKEYRTSLITSAVTGQIKVTANQQQRLSA